MPILYTIPLRLFNLGGFVICVCLLAYAYYLQFYVGLEPCPLCIIQRGGVITLGIIFLIAALHNPQQTARRLYAILLGLTGLASAGVAAWHFRLQHLPPDQVPDCGPGLDYMLEVFPLNETLRRVFTGSGECAEIVWTFLGLSMPFWTMFCFLGLGLLGLIRNWKTAP